MTPESVLSLASVVRFAAHVRAAGRHMQWAMDFAAVGDDAAALDAILDLQAVVSEIRDDQAA
jgi:hypothetical protein